MAIQRLFGQLYAPVLDDLRIRIDNLINRHADRPWTGVDPRILKRCLVVKKVGAGSGESFDYLYVTTREVPRAVKPNGIVEAGDLNNQRVTFPVAV